MPISHGDPLRSNVFLYAKQPPLKPHSWVLYPYLPNIHRLQSELVRPAFLKLVLGVLRLLEWYHTRVPILPKEFNIDIGVSTGCPLVSSFDGYMVGGRYKQINVVN